jgi:glycogen debranching enzyme
MLKSSKVVPALEEVIQVNDRFYILATSPRVDEQTRVLKQGDTFAVFDRFGDIQPAGLGEEGLYHEGTRFLSRLRLLINERRPLLLSSTVREDNLLLTVDLTNPDHKFDGEMVLARDTIHVFRTSFLWKGICYNRIEIRNFALRPIRAPLRLVFAADFVDIFEVRGMERKRRGTSLPARVEPSFVELAYRGLDNTVRRTRISFSPPPNELSETSAAYEVEVPPQETRSLYISIACNAGEPSAAVPFEAAAASAASEMQGLRANDAMLRTSNELFNDWLNRSAADLHMMVTHTASGPYPYAGVPWFSTFFGRDGIITALEYLWINPQLARGVLGYLAATQATAVNLEQDAEPGKILHEARRGEMAALGEIPFGQYYGSVDATPLFVMLASAYYRRSADLAFIETIWPNIERALHWMEAYGDSDGDGFCDYVRKTDKGLVTQGWKDSIDSVFHADGALAEAPVALCEVQGYVYAAWRAAAELATSLGFDERAARYADNADRLQEQFEEAFWCEDLSTYALALDRHKRPCRVRTSNAGHCLFSGIANSLRALRVARTLLDEASFSGWGIRTVAASESRYNPMSYHNGSIWPHDNALIALGFARYGLQHEAQRILTGLFDASIYMDLRRMPELFCGFARRESEGPTRYPVACAPQAWAAGSVFLLVQACLGLTIDAPRAQIRFFRPALPESLQRLWIQNLRAGTALVDLYIERHPSDVSVSLVRREGNVDVLVVK